MYTPYDLELHAAKRDLVTCDEVMRTLRSVGSKADNLASSVVTLQASVEQCFGVAAGGASSLSGPIVDWVGSAISRLSSTICRIEDKIRDLERCRESYIQQELRRQQQQQQQREEYLRGYYSDNQQRW